MKTIIFHLYKIEQARRTADKRKGINIYDLAGTIISLFVLAVLFFIAAKINNNVI